MDCLMVPVDMMISEPNFNSKILQTKILLAQILDQVQDLE
jgi:hypothetical protein